MKFRSKFTQQEADSIRGLLDQKNLKPGKQWQLSISDKIRALGFYMSDYGTTKFTSQDFDKLIQGGRVQIIA